MAKARENGEDRLDRRVLLRSAAVTATALMAGCTDDGAPAPASSVAGAGATPDPTVPAEAVATTPSATSATLPVEARTFDTLPICQLTPSAAEGPFPNRADIDRSDITEGRPGTPLVLGFRVIADGCTPIPDAVVRVWHTDHTGDYSSYDDGGSGKDEGEGTTFLRGSQTTDANGIAVFHSIFPGWYEGRAIHIHLGVDAPDGRSLVTQVYFDERLTSQVITQGVYAELGLPDTSVEDDFLARDPVEDGTQMVGVVDGTGDEVAVTALLNLGLPA